MDDLEAKRFVLRARYLRGEHEVASGAFERLRNAVMATRLEGFARVELHRDTIPILVVALPAEYEWRALLTLEVGRPTMRVVLYRDGIELAKQFGVYSLPLEFNGETFVGPRDPDMGPPDGFHFRTINPVRVVLEQLLQHVLKVKPPATT